MLRKISDIGLKVITGLILGIALILSFTISDYYIFNRIGQFNFVFVFSQWMKKAGLLLLPLAVYYNKKSCSDIFKYVLPVFVILSCALFGTYFNVTPESLATTPSQLMFAHMNGFMPKWANMTLFFMQNALLLIACALLFVRDGYKVKGKSFIYLPFAIVGCMPLNIFENFFDINKISATNFFRFKNFTLWHFVMILVVVGFTVGAYYFLRKKDKKTQDDFLVAAAIVMLIQYHSKDSMVIGDGYNVYHSVFACIPLFICNIGVYIAAASVIFKKKLLYAISFFVHSAGAVSVFVYFGKDSMSNYGIICSYSILYFCLTHILLFALSVLPSALGHYKFKMKDSLIPLAYYFGVIVVATISSALVTSYLDGYTYQGYVLGDEVRQAAELLEGDLRQQQLQLLLPNYAFTQVNPFPFELPVWGPTIWHYQVNLLYVLGLYAAYVGIFFAFNGAYYAFLAVRKKVLAKLAARVPAPAVAEGEPDEVAQETASAEVVEESALAEENSQEPQEQPQEEQTEDLT